MRILPLIQAVALGTMAAASYAADAKTCADVNVTYGDSPAVRSEERLTFPAATPLHIEGARNGGIQVYGTTGRDIAVTVCRIASVEDGGESLLSRIRIVNDGSSLSAEGPDDRNWTVFFVVAAPDGSELDMTVHNGPLSIRSIDGRITGQAQNGPISLREVGGTVVARAQNGPISLSRGSGDIRIEARNGPLTLELDGSGWVGRGLDASTKNGPVMLEIPKAYASGVTLLGSKHSPLRCEDEMCPAGSWPDGRERRLEFGSGPTVVRVETTNGPVSVRSND